MIFQAMLVSFLVLTPLELDPNYSSIVGSFEQSTFMPGTIIGNWDEVDNPEGTRTLPGVWGGSGNNLIPCELTPTLGGPFDSPCVGGLSIEPDFNSALMVIDGLIISAFDGEAGSFPITLGMLFDTFRSVDPDSLYFGGIQIDIPLGEGSLTTLKFEQIVKTNTTLVPTGDQTWSFEADVPVTITLELEVLGTSTGPLTSPGVFQITGTLEQLGNQFQLSATSSWGSEETIEDIPLVFENAPFDAPTIIPAGNIAHLLLSAAAESATITTTTNLQFTAIGGTLVPGDVDGDGVVDVADLLAIIAAWGPCDGCAEDLNNDGQVNVNDLLEVIASWSGS